MIMSELEFEKTFPDKKESKKGKSLKRKIANFEDDGNEEGFQEHNDEFDSSNDNLELIVKNRSKVKSVWQDDDDETAEVDVSNFTVNNRLKRSLDSNTIGGREYEKRLREKFAASSAIASKPSWAVTFEEKYDEEDESMSALFALTRSTGKITTTSQYLPKTYINSAKQKDITVGHNGNGPLVHVKFHPTRTVLMTAGQKDNKISLFEVCNSSKDLTIRKGNNFLQDISLPNYEIASCDFYNYGQNIFIGSVKRSYFYTYDLIDGKVSEIPRPTALPKYNYGKFTISDDGQLIAFIGASSQVYVYELKTMVAVHTFTASAKLADVKFAPGDHTTLYGYSVDGAVFIWDLHSPEYQRCFYDEGCVGPTCLAVSKNGQFIACGTGTAIVNVYSRATIEQMIDKDKTVKPVYTVDNLTTKVNKLAFNHDAQLLAFLSPIKRMSYRLSHVASGTTYQNFPPKQEMLQKEIATCVDFSPHSSFVAFGTMSGFVRLYRLNGYSEY